MRLPLLFSLILIFTTSASYSAIYEWTNKQGNTAYTQTPPGDKNIDSKKIEIKAQGINKNVRSYQAPAEMTTEAPTETLSEEKSKQIAEGKKLLLEQCSNAKKALESLDLGGNRLYKDNEGNYLRLTEKDKKQRRDNLSSFITEHCQ